METSSPLHAFFSLGLLLCVAHLTVTTETFLVLEYPAPSWVVILSACAAILLLFGRIQLLLFRPNQQYAAVPLEELGNRNLSSPTSSTNRFSTAQSHSPRYLWLRRGLLALVLVVRTSIFQRARATSLEAIVPVFIAIVDCWQNLYRHARFPSHGHDDRWARRKPAVRLFLGYACSPVVYVPILSGFSALAISFKPSALPSSYISSRTQLDAFSEPALAVLGVCLDGVLAMYLYTALDPAAKAQAFESNIVSLGISSSVSRNTHLASQAEPCTSFHLNRRLDLPTLGFLSGSALTQYDGQFAAAFWLVLALPIQLWKLFQDTNRGSFEPENFFLRILGLATVCAFATFFALYSVLHDGFLDTSLLTLCTVAYVSLTSKIWSQETSFLDTPGSKIMISLGLLVGVILRSLPELAGEHTAHSQGKAKFFKKRGILFHLFCLLFTVQAFQVHWGTSNLQHHQVETLMHSAKEQYQSWLKRASSSTSLNEAVATYAARHNRYPPPNFDEWYTYAQDRSSYIIDEFEAIYEDLLPFWSLSPAEIRRRTREALSSPTGGLGGVTIRNGEAKPVGDGPNSERWELSTMAEMINNFAKFLPDMDLVFNLNDECRVSLPYHELKNAREIEESNARKFKTRSSATNHFSTERAKGWSAEPEEHLNLDRFIVLSFQNTFDFSSTHCQPNSPARSEVQDPQVFCASCASPHSLDLFMSNWTLAADVCHQPDLAHLHGFYISPAAFDGTAHLMPIFSQSKAGGFQDIRHPSPFNYMGTAKYMPSEEFPDPEWGMKKHAVLWRGANSDGFSRGGTGAWRGMERQRVVNLLQNTPVAQAILLPATQRNDRFHYALVDPQDLHASLDTDVRFSQIYRCDEPDCGDQESLFGIGSKKNFQEHWGYKYLVDADGAGYSGRFIPFLLSKSLPFKMALFREWWEGRVFPWLHFVPLDLRGHGLWASLAYFAGFKGSAAGNNVYWPPMDDQAKVIADEGAAWARKALRKEDMEIYMFRLLLEWGRLTDDRRSEIGFEVHS